MLARGPFIPPNLQGSRNKAVLSLRLCISFEISVSHSIAHHCHYAIPEHILYTLSADRPRSEAGFASNTSIRK
jgi:hypothetical protein